jgi:benzoyl-CoA reductase/2-hydroxyglutaryl-CoA dehydratase subunit BcrC/BadD/HgdB
MGNLKKNDQLEIKTDFFLGCSPLYPPLELFHSMGITPQVLWGFKDTLPDLSDSDRHLQNYTCSVTRCLTQYVLSESSAELNGLFIYNACDTLRNLPEILKWGLAEDGRTLPVFTIHIPMGSSGQTRKSIYLKKEIATLIRELEETYSVSFSAEHFKKSTQIYNKMRNLYKQMDMLVATGKLRFDEYAQLVRRGCLHPVNQNIKSLEIKLQDLDSLSLGSMENKIDPGGVILSGILPPPPGITRVIENADLRIVGNDIAMLTRSFFNTPEPTDDPEEYYQKYYQHHYPCPTLLHTADDRIETLMNLISQRDAKGVIFIGEKFCEYENFEMPYLEKQLKQQGLHSLFLEVSMDDNEHIGAFKTRIEAFSELIHASRGQ